MQRNISLLLVALILGALGTNGIEVSSIFGSINDDETFSENLLPALATNDSVTEVTRMVEGSGGSLFIAGHIEETDAEGPGQSFVADEEDDEFGEQDMFLIRLAQNGTAAWTKRFGSKGFDVLNGLTVDSEDNVYLSGSVGRDIGVNTAGAVIFKYNSTGSRVWVRTFGSKAAQDSFNGVRLNEDGSELLVAGTIGTHSSLHTSETKKEGFGAIVARISTSNGNLVALAAGENFEGSLGTFGNDIAVKFSNNTGACFVAGYEAVKPSDTYMNNAIMYAFSYPELKLLSKQKIETQTVDSFSSLATSLNDFSVFAVGKGDVSIYEQENALVARFNASDLAAGWSHMVGSTTYPDQASIVAGGASEVGRQVAIDEFGNVYMLLEASGPVGREDGQAELSNKRSALIMFAPNGTELYRVQSTWNQTVGPSSMIIRNGKVLVGGWTVDEVTKLYKAHFGGVALPEGVYQRHGEEYVPPAVDHGNGGEGNTGGDRTSEASTGNSNVGAIAGGAAGGVALIAIVVVGVALGMHAKRKRNGPRPTE